ncbi:hypothetical protein HOY80DRAFT_1077557 [Tuber brumale]|nr:hypothetical protein HOY80DRAFT_1077557 [Tuber brumale]
MATMEAARVIWNMIGEEHRENFVVVGGTALLFYGSTIVTNDTNLATAGDSLDKFRNLAKEVARFSETVYGKWEYTSSYDFITMVDFVDKEGGGGSMHKLKGYSIINGIPVATLVDLAIGGGAAWVERRGGKDLSGIEYAATMMALRGLSFKVLDAQTRGFLDDIMINLRESPRGRQLLRRIRGLL